jgi:UDP-2,3-diacylglucosamine pyrophosphatase LpxH
MSKVLVDPIKRRFRSVFLSDFHMGAKSFDAAAVVRFLASMECDHLFLVGDIIDGWKLKKRWYWTPACQSVLDELMKKRASGTDITYLHGNHDDELRYLMPAARHHFKHRFGIKIQEKAMHTLKDGRQFLVLHGDQFDRKILRGPISKWSDRIYDGFLDLINGHTHIPVLKTIKDITYANCGSWLKHGHTALVETAVGDIKLIDWPASFENMQFDVLSRTISADIPAERALSLELLEHIHSLWPVSKSRQKPSNRAKAASEEIVTIA